MDPAANPTLTSILLGTLGLTLLAILAAGLTVARRPRETGGLGRIAVVAIAIQSGHFTEEFLTGFPQRFPELLGLAPWSATFFLTFNLAWLALWILATLALQPTRPWTLFPLWFLALGSLANAVAHPTFAILTGGYFPGLVTSPFSGVAGAVLLFRLLRATRPR